MVHFGSGEGLFGLHCLRFNLDLFMVTLFFFMFTFVLYGAHLWFVWCLFDFLKVYLRFRFVGVILGDLELFGCDFGVSFSSF